ncbi:MAG: monovalent cation:proton antiporter family protein [Bacteroidetes bacterium]|nr:monovalent cation:proton antiporter family protein [Bacteroidota bacterium]
MMDLLTISFDFDFYPLLIIVFIAWAIPMLMSILRITKIPTVVVEILAGYFIGRSLLMGYPTESIVYLDFLALTGFIFLMFLGGLEINMNQVIASFPRHKITYSRYLNNPLLIGLMYYFVTIFVSLLATFLLSNIIEINNIWYFSLIMVTTSIGIILRVLKNRAETNTHFGQMIILAAAIADIFSIILITISAFVIKNGFRSELVYLLLLVVLFYLLYFFGKGFDRVSTFKKISYQLAHAASQIQIRGAILLILTFVVLAQFIGKEVVLLGAFLSGLLLSLFLQKDRSLSLVKLDGFGYGFFIPMFFIMIGVHFDATALSDLDNSQFLFLALLLTSLFAIKIIPSFLWIRVFGFRKAISGGFLMSSRLGLIIAAAAIGYELDLISAAANASFILVAVIACIVSPIVYGLINPQNIKQIEKTIIVGGSSIGVLLARRLHLHAKASVIIEKRKERYEDLKSKGLEAFLGDGFDFGTYKEIGMNPSNHIVVLTGNDQENIRICEMLRKEFMHERIISKSGTSSIEQKLKSLEVDTFDATRILANSIENLIIRPSTYHALIESYENFNIAEIQIVNSNIDGMQVKEIPFHGGGTIMMIRRGRNMYIPHGDTYLRVGDIVNIFGTNPAIEDFQKKLS